MIDRSIDMRGIDKSNTVFFHPYILYLPPIPEKGLLCQIHMNRASPKSQTVKFMNACIKAHFIGMQIRFFFTWIPARPPSELRMIVPIIVVYESSGDIQILAGEAEGVGGGAGGGALSEGAVGVGVGDGARGVAELDDVAVPVGDEVPYIRPERRAEDDAVQAECGMEIETSQMRGRGEADSGWMRDAHTLVCKSSIRRKMPADGRSWRFSGATKQSSPFVVGGHVAVWVIGDGEQRHYHSTYIAAA